MLGRGGLSIPGLIADKLRCCRASYLQIPSQAALAECLWPRRGRWVSLIRRAGAQLAKGRRAHTSVPCTGKEQRLLSSPRGTMCVGLIRETPFAIQMNEGFGVRNAVSKQESVVQEPGCGYSPAPPPVPCSSLISLPWRWSQESCVVSLQHCSSPYCFLQAPAPTCLARLIIFSL